MVLLCDGDPLPWPESVAAAPALRAAALRQLRRTAHDAPGGDPTRWGDEVEYTVLDDATRLLRLDGDALVGRVGGDDGHYMIEYARWMIEGVPAEPYTTLWQMESNLAARRAAIAAALPAGAVPVTIGAHPLAGRVGAPYVTPHVPPGGPIADSAHAGDACITPYPRFTTLTRNIRARRGRNVCVELADADGRPFALDAMLFGMGCCSLQVTVQARDRAHAAELHDAFVVLAPLFLALSAATPAIAGRPLASDARWHLVSQSVDDRTPEESAAGLPPRFGAADLYLAPAGARHNDVPVDVDAEAHASLVSAGVPDGVARGLAACFVREPLVVFPAQTEEDETGVNALETYLSTYWKSVRVKPPARCAAWRVEFRPMEPQPTDFENAAFATIAVVAARALVDRAAVPYAPISRVQADLRAACGRDAVRTLRVPWGDGRASVADVVGSPEDPASLLGVCAAALRAWGEMDEAVFGAYATHVAAVARGDRPTTAARLRSELGVVDDDATTRVLRAL